MKFWLPVCLLFLLLLAPTAAAQQYNEAPMLAELVERGELPPVGERLPDEPVVMEPWHSVGEYGGTWYREDNRTDWAFVRMKMYGFSPVRFARDALDIEPNWIQSWERNDDATHWTLHLRRGIKWSDGEPFTSADFIFWWEHMAQNEEMSEQITSHFVSGGEVAQIEAPDDFTLEVYYDHPFPLLIERFAMHADGGMTQYLVAPAHYLKQFHPDFSDEYSDFEVFEEKMEWWTNLDCPVITEWKPVEHDVGSRLVLERNPFYYAVDPEGNQLPYIDRMVTNLNEDIEVIKLRLMSGEVDMQLRPYLDMTDLTMLIDQSEEFGYQVLQWDSGSGTGPMFFWNWNHPDDERRELYRTQEFRQAMSFGFNRERVRDMLFFGLGETTTGTMSPKTPIFHRPGGQELFHEWTDSYRDYKPELAEELLDSIGVVDQNGDGWRQFPSGRELILRIDFDAASSAADIQTCEMASEDWAEIGLRVEMNPMDGAALNVVSQNAEFDIRGTWEIGGVANIVLQPHWVVPVDLSRWAPLYGSWYQQEQLGRAHEEADRGPRDRTPPRAQPDPDGPIAQMQAWYHEATTEPDQAKRDALFHKVFRMHIDEGPFMFGSVRDYPRIVIVKNNFHNVPTGDDLPLGGFVNPWNIPHPAITNPAQYWISQ